MVATFRCNEMKDEALERVKDQLDSLKAQSDLQVIEGFGASCTAIMDEVCNFFKESAKQYNSEISSKILNELQEQLYSQLYSCFDSQLKLIRQRTYDKVGTEIKKLQQKPLEEVADQLAKILNALISQNMQSYASKAKSLVIAGSGWEQKVALHTKDLQNQLDRLAQSCKDKLLTEVSQRATKAHEDKIKEVIHSTIDSLDDELAKTLKDSYVEQIETFNENLQDILKRGFGMDREQVFDFLGKSEKDAYDYCIKELKSVFSSSAPQSLLRKFNNSFKKNECGKLREWREIEEAKIKDLFEEKKKVMDSKVDQFKRIYFPTGITKMEESKRSKDDSQKTVTMEDLMDNPDCDNEDFNNDGGFRRSRTSISISSIRILTEEEVNRVRTKFNEEIEQVFVEAIRAHVSIIIFSCFICLISLLFFVYRKILRMPRFRFTCGHFQPGSLLITLLAT